MFHPLVWNSRDGFKESTFAGLTAQLLMGKGKCAVTKKQVGIFSTKIQFTIPGINSIQEAKGLGIKNHRGLNIVNAALAST